MSQSSLPRVGATAPVSHTRTLGGANRRLDDSEITSDLRRLIEKVGTALRDAGFHEAEVIAYLFPDTGKGITFGGTIPISRVEEFRKIVQDNVPEEKYCFTAGWQELDGTTHLLTYGE